MKKLFLLIVLFITGLSFGQTRISAPEVSTADSIMVYDAGRAKHIKYSDFKTQLENSGIGSGGSSIPVSDTGTTIDFTGYQLFNEVTYLTSGNLTLDLTGAVKGAVSTVYCNGYVPNITGENYFISGGSASSAYLNIYSFFYDGTNIFLNIGNVDNLNAPSLSLTSGDTQIEIDWNAIANADNYVLERSTDNFATAGTEIYNGALLTYTDTGLTNGTTYYYRAKAEGNGYIVSPWSTVQSMSPAVVNPYLTNLVASYNFNSDSSDYTNNHDGIDSNMSYATSGKVSNLATFNSSSSDITVTDSDDFSFTDGAGNDTASSISFWASFDNFSTTRAIINKFLAGGSGNEWLVNVSTTDLQVVLYSAGGSTVYIGKKYDITGLSTATLYHFVITYDGSETEAGIKIYRDGSLQTMTSLSSGSYTGMSNTTQGVIIGSRTSSTRWFDGGLDELHIWKGRELDSTEVNDIYTNENAGTSILP